MNFLPVPAASPRLVVCAATWSLAGHPRSRPWSLERQLTEIRAAGFDGVCTYVTPELRAAADPLGLALMSGFDAPTLPVGLERLRVQAGLGVHYINIQLLRHDTPLGPATRAAARLAREAERLGVAVHFETHRDTATETPEKFTALAQAFRRATGQLLPVTWDHSHFAVSKHVQAPDYAARLLAWPALIQASRMFHLRPFNSQHCQIPVTDGRGRLTPEAGDYFRFVRQLFACWRAGPAVPSELWVCPELGMSHGYHLSTDRPAWPEAVRARREILAAWRAAGRGA